MRPIPLTRRPYKMSGLYSGTAGKKVKFDGGGSNDPDGKIMGYNRDFGDGKDAIGETPDHKYKKAGTCTVILTVEDNADDTTTVVVD